MLAAVAESVDDGFCLAAELDSHFFRRLELEGLPRNVPNPVVMRAMALIWAVILIGWITYFSIIGLTHH
ncbi:MAG TPA: hypothetical protein VN756_01795 [Solirubrobacterales bacterium]|nr:hypothetical protein [Solirubrobacterales bacterium]